MPKFVHALFFFTLLKGQARAVTNFVGIPGVVAAAAAFQFAVGVLVVDKRRVVEGGGKALAAAEVAAANVESIDIRSAPCSNTSLLAPLCDICKG